MVLQIQLHFGKTELNTKVIKQNTIQMRVEVLMAMKDDRGGPPGCDIVWTCGWVPTFWRNTCLHFSPEDGGHMFL